MVNSIKYAAVNIIETLLRGFPIPCKTGLVKIGDPDRKSPVFLTCNYHLTVERVKKCLHGIDCYLLVANSRGINVWCASAGGYFTNHSVISILKTSGIEGLVDHRTVVLPQLAATGVEAGVIQEKTGWKVIWGPVYAKDIPAYVKTKFKKTRAMREVRFPTVQRVEMAVMWAFPFSAVAGLITLTFWRELFLPLTGLIWALPLSIFLSFPLYSKRLNQKKKMTGFNKYTVLFDFSPIPLLLWGVFIGFLTLSSILTNTFTWGYIFRWGLISFIIVLLISIDLMGSTPVYKSGLHEDRFLKVVLDEKRCKGAGFCEQVCPRNCYEVDRNRHIATMPGADRCVQCGACIVQCPFDALYFKSPKDEIIPPETIRRFKLNLIGKRLVKVEGK
ncbi:corrinoid/iron-sulfur protein large subunit [archaeon BMS3Abin16]|nr:corrinoid/iron-sulfur protein large subunit [archaeon BMS3Abin16]